MGVTGDIDRLNALRNTRSRLFPENLKRSMPEWTGKNRQGWLRTFLVDMDKNAGLHVELESDRLGVDDEPEGQERSAITPGSVEQQTDQRVDVPPSGAGVRSTNQRNARRGRISPGNRFVET